MISDSEIRGRLLSHFHAFRHNADGWVPANDIVLSPAPVSIDVVGGVCQQLADIGLIQWKPLRGGNFAGMAKITGRGVAAVEARRCDGIDIRFPQEPATATNAPSAEEPAIRDKSTAPPLAATVSAPEEWITAAQTARLLKPVFNSEHVARQTICKRAHNGLVRARAECFMIGEEK